MDESDDSDSLLAELTNYQPGPEFITIERGRLEQFLRIEIQIKNLRSNLASKDKIIDSQNALIQKLQKDLDILPGLKLYCSDLQRTTSEKLNLLEAAHEKTKTDLSRAIRDVRGSAKIQEDVSRYIEKIAEIRKRNRKLFDQSVIKGKLSDEERKLFRTKKLKFDEQIEKMKMENKDLAEFNKRLKSDNSAFLNEKKKLKGEKLKLERKSVELEKELNKHKLKLKMLELDKTNLESKFLKLQTCEERNQIVDASRESASEE